MSLPEFMDHLSSNFFKMWDFSPHLFSSIIRYIFFQFGIYCTGLAAVGAWTGYGVGWVRGVQAVAQVEDGSWGKRTAEMWVYRRKRSQKVSRQLSLLKALRCKGMRWLISSALSEYLTPIWFCAVFWWILQDACQGSVGGLNRFEARDRSIPQIMIEPGWWGLDGDDVI